MLKVLTGFATRREAIKMAPLITELERHPGVIYNRNCLTGQHKDMVAHLIELFSFRADYELNLARENQTLEHITVSMLQEVGKILREEKFDLLLVQGDTTTSMAAAPAAFFAVERIGHVEAGLRTFDKHHPYPEESNRKMIDAVADLFFAPRDTAKLHLLNKGIADSKIALTGNTVIDALLDANRFMGYKSLDLTKKRWVIKQPLVRLLSKAASMLDNGTMKVAHREWDRERNNKADYLQHLIFLKTA